MQDVPEKASYDVVRVEVVYKKVKQKLDNAGQVRFLSTGTEIIKKFLVFNVFEDVILILRTYLQNYLV